MKITPNKTNMETVMDKTRTVPLVEVKYTNKQVEMLKATCLDNHGKFDEKKWQTMKESMESTGAKFPNGVRNHIATTEVITKVDTSVTSAFRSNLEYISPQGRKGYTLDADGKLVEMSLLCRIIEPNKNQWKADKVNAIKNSIKETLKTKTK